MQCNVGYDSVTAGMDGHSNWHADRVCRSRDDEAGWLLLTLAIVYDGSFLSSSFSVVDVTVALTSSLLLCRF